MLNTFLIGRSHPGLSMCSAALLACGLILPGMPDGTLAQTPSPITSSGLNTTITKSGHVYDITGGTRPSSGPNLFHSFGEFGVPTNNVANFLNDAALPTSNILGRVTGGNPSHIFGTIQTTGFGGANLFLMNPAGIVFGPTASLNVGGSVNFTTADYLRLADGATFTALPEPHDTAISSAPVAAFGFLGSHPGAITLQGSQLAVPEGQGIALVGGNIEITAGTPLNGTAQPARITAPGGQINLVSVGSAGEVLGTGAGAALTDPILNGFTSFGNISLSQGTSLDTSADKAGRIVIRGGQLTMDDASLKTIAVNSWGEGADGTVPPAIFVTAETIALKNGTLITADTHGSAPAGDIVFNVDSLTTKAGANRVLLNPPIDDGTLNGNLIASDSRSINASGGAAGNITMQGTGGPGTASSSVTLEDTSLSSRIFGGTTDIVPSRITITADSVLLTNRVLPDETGAGAATMVTTSLGPSPAGDIALNVDTLRVNMNPDGTPIQGARRVFLNTPSVSAEDTAGPAGALTISGLGPESTDPATLVALNNAQLSSAVLGGTASLVPGVIRITSDTLSFTGRTVFFAFTSRSAPGSNITFNVNSFRANVNPDGTMINGQPPSSIFSVSGSDTGTAGKSGDITIAGIAPTSAFAQSVALNNTDFNTTVGGGTAVTKPATIAISTDTLRLSTSRIRTDTSGGAPAGNIAIDAVKFQADQETRISSNSSSVGAGGNISLSAVQSVSLSNGASISASSTGSGNAGNITINAGPQFLSQNSSITTEANQASGGNILIQATDSIRLINSRLSTSVQGGPNTSGGNITLDPAVVTLQNSQVLAQAVQGQGGNINIIAGTFLTDQTSVVSASSQFGLSGTVNIQSPVSSLSNTLATLPQRPLQAQPLLTQRCAAQGNGQLSSLVVAGRDTLPVEPGGWLMSPMTFLINDEPSSPAAGESFDPLEQKQALAEPWGEQLNSLPQQNVSDWAAGCRS